MTKITFTIIKTYELDLPQTKDIIFDDYIDVYRKYKVFYDDYKHETTTNIYVKNILVEATNEKISTFIEKNFGKTDYTDIIIEKRVKIVHELTNEELLEPIVTYLIDNDICRCCWIINGLNVNIKKKFSDYDGTEYLGFLDHHNCNISHCDLVTYCVGKSRIIITQNLRCEHYEVEYISHNKKSETNLLRLPVISNKKKILEIFICELNYFDESSELRTIDLDLYHVVTTNTKKEISRINTNDDFVLNFFCKNKHGLFKSMYDNHHKYVVVCKYITTSQLNEYVFLPRDILDIVYTYADFENLSCLL